MGFTTQVQVDQLSPFGYMGHDVVIELTIDKEGKVANYSAHGSITRDDMKQLGNLILFTSFRSGHFVFGQPTSGKILLSSHRINVQRVMARQKLGQHFLADQSVLKRIAVAACPDETPIIVEIGPGKGALTEYLLPRAFHVAAIELDRDLASDLPLRFPALEVVQGDALQVDLNRWPGAPVVGNLPYYVATPIISRVVRLGRSSVFLVQKEVAQRIAAKPGSRDYGYFSLEIQFFAHAEMLFTVRPGSFRPPPQVDSAVVRFTPYAALPDVDPELSCSLSAGHFGKSARRFETICSLSMTGTRWRASPKPASAPKHWTCCNLRRFSGD